jgi:hypothetical protein
MRNFMKATMIGLAVLALGLIGSVTPASAGVFNLNNWNNTQLDASDDFVQVRTGANCAGTDTICVQWNEGAIVEGPNAQGIDQFFYDNDGSANGSTALTISSISGNTDTWSFNFNGTQGDGFGGFDSHKSSGPSENSLSLVFTIPGSDNATSQLDEFALHVRYLNNCSGWVSNRTGGTPTSDANCGTAVPEPAPLGLMAIGILGLLLVRRWASRT